MTDETFRFRVEQIVPESPRVKTFRLRPVGSGLPFRFSPGQHLGVRPAQPNVPDPEHEKWRHFSLSSSPSEECLEITVLKQGTVSDRMHSLTEGDWVEATRPVGAFVLEEGVGHGPVFFAGGIGIAPIRSMIRFCLEMGLGEAVSLFASFPAPEEVVYGEEMKAWADRDPRFSFRLAFTGSDAKRSGADQESHPWDQAFLEEHVERPIDRVYYLCAPRGLMEKVETHLKAMGVPEEQVRRERW